MDIIITGLLLGSTYALIALGLNLQYGVARIMNLANGEMLVLGALAAFWIFVADAISPLLTMLIVAPLSFIGNWLIYRFLLRPLVRRAKNQGQLEVDSILATFGMSFAIVGIMVSIHGEYFTYSYLAEPFQILGDTYALNRIVAFCFAVLLGAILFAWLYFTRQGMAIRAVVVNTEASGLVGIDVPRLSARAFAIGGAVTTMGGTLISTFIVLDASVGVVFTMKALIIIIMGGVGDIRGALVAALLLGLVETTVARLIDPGLTLAAAYAMFVIALLVRPEGLFGRKPT